MVFEPILNNCVRATPWASDWSWGCVEKEKKCMGSRAETPCEEKVSPQRARIWRR